MVRSLLMLTLVSTCVAACSQQSAPPSAGSDQTASPAASSSAPAAQPPAPSEPAAPAATNLHPADTAPAAAARPSASAPPAGAPHPAPAGQPAAAPAAPAAAAAPAAPAAPPEPPKPQFREVTIPAGTSLSVKLLTHLASNTSHVEDAVKGSIARPVVIDGATAIPEGTPISGAVVEANESGRVKGRASVSFKFDRMSIRNESQKIHAAAVTREAAADKKSDVKKGGIGAGLGAVVGGVIGGGKGAAIGAVAGGTGTVLATKGDEIEVPAGTVVSVLLQEPLTVTVPIN